MFVRSALRCFHLPYDTGEILKKDEAAWEAALRLACDVEHGLRPGEDWSFASSMSRGQCSS
jgi:hypothetical protein